MTNTFHDIFAGDGQRFIDRFDGDALRSWWTENDVLGTGTFAMLDDINEGFSITTGSTTNDASAIDFNDIRQYSNTNSGLISIHKQISATTTVTNLSGLVNPSFFYNRNSSMVGIHTTSDANNFVIRTADNDATSGTGTTVSTDTNWHEFRNELNSSNSLLWIDKSFELVKTTNLPTLKLQPAFLEQTLTSSTREGRIRYMEAWNR